MILSIIIVSWNTRDLLKQCLHSVFTAGHNYELEVFVVDNASSDGSASMVKREFTGVKLISNSSNVGFAAGNNQALRLCSGRYVLLLNPDTILSRECLTQLVNFADKNVKVGAIGAKLLNADGSPQGCDRGSLPTVWTLVNHAFFLSRIFHWSDFSQGHIPPYDSDGPIEIDWVSGACLLLNRVALKQVGFLDERIFMYGEDVELCLRLKNAGWKVFYHPKARIIHFRSQSFLKQDNAFLRTKTLGWSSLKNRVGLCLFERFVICSGLILRLCIYLCLYLIKRRPEIKVKCLIIWKAIVLI